MKYLLIIIALLLILTFISLFMVMFALKRDFRFKLNIELGISREEFDLYYIGDLKTQTIINNLSEEIGIISDDNLELKAWYIKNNSHKYMILCHGYTGSHIDMNVIGLKYYNRGFNVLCPDARAHGKSQGKYRGMGYLERKDIKKWMDYIISKDSEAQIVLYGVSMGGATVMMSMCYYHPENLKCVVEDCGYGSVWKQFESVMKNTFHVGPFPIMNIASYLSKLICKYSFLEASIYEDIKKNEVPILFIHGDGDDFVPSKFVYELYDLNPGDKQLYVVPKASHAFSVIIDSEAYDKQMNAFINKYISD